MERDEFNRLRHIAWDFYALTGYVQSFCICETPSQHYKYKMDPDGSLAKAILEPKEN